MNGQKFKIKVYGFSIWSIGAKGSARRRWSALFDSIFDIVAKSMAVRMLNQIKQGAAVNIAGMDINLNEASGQRILRDPIHITKHNFGGCVLDGYNVRIADREGRKLYTTSDNNPNALLLPYILNDLFKN